MLSLEHMPVGSRTAGFRKGTRKGFEGDVIECRDIQPAFRMHRKPVKIELYMFKLKEKLPKITKISYLSL